MCVTCAVIGEETRRKREIRRYILLQQVIRNGAGCAAPERVSKRQKRAEQRDR